MRHWKSLVFTTLASATLMSMPAVAPAQISVNIGGAPACPYGYYDYAPYDLLPLRVLRSRLVQWWHLYRAQVPGSMARMGFYGHVDNRYDPHYGYHGPMPGRGDRPFNHFQGNEARDGQGHIGKRRSRRWRRARRRLFLAVDTRVAGTDRLTEDI